jgi:Mg2+/Co2+ transporter CorB
MALIGFALFNIEPSALAINVADETMQADLGVHMATLVITYLLLCGGVLLDDFRRHTR